MSAPFEGPSEAEFLEALAIVPLEANPSDGYWRYQLVDDAGFQLILSFHELERSVQTVLLFKGQELAAISHEGAISLCIGKAGTAPVLIGTFEAHGSRTKLHIEVEPTIRIRWASLITQP